MSYHIFTVNIPIYKAFQQAFPDYMERNEDFIIVKDQIDGWLDPPEIDNRRKMVLRTLYIGEIFLLIKNGTALDEFIQWMNANNLHLESPMEFYLS